MLDEMKEYFGRLNRYVERAHLVATKAREKNYDPESAIDIPIAKDVADRVEGLISDAWKDISKKGVPERIRELEKEYSPSDWRVALVIAYEIANENFCKFDSREKALEMGVRAGLAYATLGIVSAPLEGFVELKIKKTRDNKEYLSNYYAGPIRASGGTAASVSVIVSDYLRCKFDYAKYDPTEEEKERYCTEIMDYHARVSRLQYCPSKEEISFMIEHLPIEINGDPTAILEVSNNKGLSRVETDRIRGGMCLVLGEGIALKANKLDKNMKKWGKSMGMDWDWLSDFLALQKKINAGSRKQEGTKLVQNFKFIEETVAGRPILAYPMEQGGFRIRYGRTRLSGLAAAAIHPATMFVLDEFIATGTQLKNERPGKATAITPCDSILGPAVKLKTGEILWIDSEEKAKRLKNSISEILFLGDILFCYGDFVEQNHFLVPSPYVPEWWTQEVMKRKGPEIDAFEKIGFIESTNISEKFKVPLHPSFTFFWRHISVEQLSYLIKVLQHSKISPESIEIDNRQDIKMILELLIVPHKINGMRIVIEEPYSAALLVQLGHISSLKWPQVNEKKSVLENINSFSVLEVRDVAGTYMGARLGRPEKAKQRKMKGKPQVLFPCGYEGGRLRDILSSVKKGYVSGEFPMYFCVSCSKETIYPVCENCGGATELKTICQRCGKETKAKTHCGAETVPYSKRKLDIKHYLNKALENLGVEMPSMLKSVRGTFNKTRVPERLEKGILRAIHDVYVNKDGTCRYDMIETPVTHFKPSEIGTPVEKLKELGYLKDINGRDLEEPEQVVEMFPQDVILPDGDFKESNSPEFLRNVCNFVDELLVKFYKLEPFYNINSDKDLIGHLLIALAPHTSAGTVCRLIGFSKTQGFYAHPYLHAGLRRNCDGDEAAILLLMDGFLNFSRKYLPDKRGSRTMDAPLVVSVNLYPMEVDSEVHNLDVVGSYPLELYEKSLEMLYAYEVKVEQVKDKLGKEDEHRNIKYTHSTTSMNSGVLVSSYKTLLTMMDKVNQQMALAEKIRAVKSSDVASLVIEKHFVRDLKGNMRKFSRQNFRCVDCNESYRRLPLTGKCLNCGGKLILTVSEGSISKYLEPSLMLSEKFNVSEYIRQTILLIKKRIESVFGMRERQEGLQKFFK